jgi:excinuclease ABC subunit C
MARIATHSRPETLFGREPFIGFGLSRFIPIGHVPSGGRVKGSKSAILKKGICKHVPKHPGVYAMLDQIGRIIYVGKAKLLRVRLMSYFREKGRDRKAGRILKRTRAIVWEHATDEFAALLRELELIQRYRPRFNVVGQPGRRRYVYLAVGKSPATVTLTRVPGKNDGTVYGPFIGRGRVGACARRLMDRFRLRDCPSTVKMYYANDPALFENPPPGPQCLRHELRMCLGPCAALCTKRQYETNVKAVKAFLDGRDRSLLDEIKAEMITASEAMHYERAAAARDKLADFTWLDERLAQLQKARTQQTLLYPVLAHDGRTTWYVIDRGQVHSATIGIAESPPAELLAAPPITVTVSDRTVDSVLLVAAWFRRFSIEKSRLIPLLPTKRIRIAISA